MSKSRATQVLVEVDITDSSPKRRATQVLTEIDISNTSPKSRATNILVEVDIGYGVTRTPRLIRSPGWGRW